MAAKKKNDQDGQALIELIVFLPLMFGLYGMISGFAGAINGSINQQKITRAYFYYRVQNNSMVPRAHVDVLQTWGKFGMMFVGWTDYFQGDDPFAPCYKISVPYVSANGSDRCESEYNGDSTQFIRVGTVYGICGATFVHTGGGKAFMVPDALGSDYRELVDVSSCTISN